MAKLFWTGKVGWNGQKFEPLLKPGVLVTGGGNKILLYIELKI